MHAEESANNEALWSAYSDAELKRLEQRLVASIPQHARQLGMRWMVPALNPAERATLLLAIRDDVPSAAFERILASLQPKLAQAEYRKLARSLAQ